MSFDSSLFSSSRGTLDFQFSTTLYDNTRKLTLLPLLLLRFRLGGFLFFRVLKTKSDGRFDEMRQHFLKFAGFWIFQVLWVVSRTFSLPFHRLILLIRSLLLSFQWVVSLPTGAARFDSPLSPSSSLTPPSSFHFCQSSSTLPLYQKLQTFPPSELGAISLGSSCS